MFLVFEQSEQFSVALQLADMSSGRTNRTKYSLLVPYLGTGR